MIRHILRGLWAVFAALLAMGVMTAPASAAANWQPINPTSTWTCRPTVAHATYPQIHFQGCVVINSNNHAQAVLVVNSANAPKAVKIGGWINSQFGSNVACADSVLNPGFQRGCFGPTVIVPCGDHLNTVHLTVNGSTSWAFAPNVRQDC